MMKRAFALAITCCFLLAGFGIHGTLGAVPLAKQLPRIRDAVPSNRFSETIQDLPLMKGLDVEPGQDVLFIFGSSRIAQTTLVGAVDVDEVYYFYQDALPQLGWTLISPREYERHGERLLLEARSTGADGKARVRFEVVPVQSPQ